MDIAIQLIIFFGLLYLLSMPVSKLILIAYGTEENASTEKLSRKILSYLKINSHEMTWDVYAKSLMFVNILGILFVYLIQRVQNYLPFNPASFSGVSEYISLNTAISFVTNTNWQAYSGESSLSYLTQMLALASQNFLSAATGICVLFVLIRGLTRRETIYIGNYYKDLLNVCIYCLLPLSIILSLILCQQGVPQTFSNYVNVKTIEGREDKLPLGPVASQIAIKQLGTNGGGYYGINSAHPLENPTPYSNFIQTISILLIPGALYLVFGKLSGKTKEGNYLYFTMMFITSFLVVACYELELSSSLNYEGKEYRNGLFSSVLFAVVTTLTSCGAVNSAHESLSALAGVIPLFSMQLGEVVFGGVGCGLYGLISFIIATVFIGGLLVGRTPEYLGKKIGRFEIQMAAICMLLPCALSLIGTAIGGVFSNIESTALNKGPHGFSELLYAYSSMGNNNGSAFGGFPSALNIHLILGAFIMFLSRYIPIIATLAMASSLAKKKIIPVTTGTLSTDTATFMFVLVSIILLLGALSYFPALALGPIADYLSLVK